MVNNDIIVMPKSGKRYNFNRWTCKSEQIVEVGQKSESCSEESDSDDNEVQGRNEGENG